MLGKVTFSFGCGDDSGAGRMGFYFAREFRRRGWRVSALCPQPFPGAASVIERLRDVGVEVEVVGLFGGQINRAVVNQFATHLRTQGSGLVVSMHQQDMKFAGLAARRTGAAYVCSGQNTFTFSGGWLKQQLSRRVLGWILNRSCAEAVATSDRVAAEFRGRLGYRGEVSVQANGVDTEINRQALGERAAVRAELGYGAHARVFVSVGRISEQKNQLGLVQAFAEAFPKGGDARLLVVGGESKDAASGGAGDDYLRRLEERIRDLGLMERVRITGWRRDVPRFLAAGDVYVQSSLWEGSPLAVVEGMAAGLPAVVTDSGGVLPDFRSETQGWVVPPGDTSALATILRFCVEKSACELRKVGQAAKYLAETQYDASLVAKRFYDLAVRHVPLIGANGKNLQ